MISFLKVATASFLLLHPALATQDGEEARWLVQSSQWGTLSWLEGEGVSNMATSIGEEDGRIFFYLMPEADNFQATLTLSEAALDPSQFEGARCGPDGDLDPEDPVSEVVISSTGYFFLSLKRFKCFFFAHICRDVRNYPSVVNSKVVKVTMPTSVCKHFLKTTKL